MNKNTDTFEFVYKFKYPTRLERVNSAGNCSLQLAPNPVPLTRYPHFVALAGVMGCKAVKFALNEFNSKTIFFPTTFAEGKKIRRE